MLGSEGGSVVKQPLGNFETRCDDKGRVRLPADWLHFFTHVLRDNRVFCTSLDGTVIRIYPESIWRDNLALFEQLGEEAEDIEHVQNMANHYGVESDLDVNGRVLIKSELRTELGLLNSLVVGTGKNGVIHLQRKVDHEAQMEISKAAAKSALPKLAKLKMR